MSADRFTPRDRAPRIAMSLKLQLAFAQLMRGGDPLSSGLIAAHIAQTERHHCAHLHLA